MIKKLILLFSLFFTSIANADYREDIYAEINQYRVSQNVLPLEPNLILEQASMLQAQWVKYAMQTKTPYYEHTTDTQWLLKNHPELRWDLLYAGFPDGLPDRLGSYHVSQLCGYEGVVSDNAAYMKGYNKVVTAWINSPGHNRNMIYNGWTQMGVSKISVRGGRTYTVCYFGQ